MKEAVHTMNSSIVVDCSHSFLLTIQLLNHIREGRTNKVKRPVLKRGGIIFEGGLFSRGYSSDNMDCTCSCAELRGSKCMYRHARV